MTEGLLSVLSVKVQGQSICKYVKGKGLHQRIDCLSYCDDWFVMTIVDYSGILLTIPGDTLISEVTSWYMDHICRVANDGKGSRRSRSNGK